MTPHWENQSADNSPISRMESLRRVIKLTKVWIVLSVVIQVVVIFFFIGQAARMPNMVLEGADGRIYRGSPTRFNVTQELFMKEAANIIQALFLVTEKGPVEGLESYVHELTLTRYRDAYDRAQIGRDSFYQRYVVAESRLIAGNAIYADVVFRGYLSARGMSIDTSGVETFILTRFMRTAETNDNPIGWMLVGILSSNREEFYAKELSEIRRRALDEVNEPEPDETQQQEAR